MIAAIVKLGKTTPFSYNSVDAKKKQLYIQSIVDAFNKNYKGKVPKFKKGVELYGQVCFFTSDGTDLDADNISKPVWDALKSIAYEDDKQVVSRTSTVVYTKIHDTIPISGETDIAADLFQLLLRDNVKCIYIECGVFSESMIEIEKEL
jgi:Holliday junction resolvase RusA-like endonuclease